MNALQLHFLPSSDHKSKVMSYNVYLVVSDGSPMNHHAIFVDIEPDTFGKIFQVTGSIQMDMIYQEKTVKRPEDSASYHSHSLLGTVAKDNFPRFREICESIEVPKKQLKGPKRLYPDEPLRRCQEWVADALQALRAAKVLEDGE